MRDPSSVFGSFLSPYMNPLNQSLVWQDGFNGSIVFFRIKIFCPDILCCQQLRKIQNHSKVRFGLRYSFAKICYLFCFSDYKSASAIDSSGPVFNHYLNIGI